MKTRQVRCGDVLIGGGAPVSVQSMTNVDSRDEKALLRQIEELQEAGCQIVRIAVFDNEAAAVLASVRKKVKVPLVAEVRNPLGKLVMKRGFTAGRNGMSLFDWPFPATAPTGNYLLSVRTADSANILGTAVARVEEFQNLSSYDRNHFSY